MGTLLATGLVAALLAAPSADTGPAIASAYSDVNGDYGVLLVTASAPDGVASIRADVKTQGGEPVATSDDFALRSGSTEDGVWASEPFLIDDLGYYPVDVTVTDTSGTAASQAGIGTLAYVVRSEFTGVAMKPAVATYEKRDVTVSGVLQGTWPGTGDVRPIAGAPIEIRGYMESAEATTGPDGAFSGSIPVTDAGNRVSVGYHDTNNVAYMSAQANVGRTAIKPRATRVTASLGARRVNVGVETTVSGVASWRTPAGWEPVSNGRIVVSGCQREDYCNDSYGETVPDAQGRYSLTFAPGVTGTVRVLYVAPSRADGYPDPFVADSTRELPVTVLQESGFSRFSAVRDGADVRVDGEVAFTSYSPVDAPIEVQFSRTGTGGWRVVADRAEGTFYDFAFTVAESRAGYWRARYPGRSDYFQSAVSEPIFVPAAG